MKLSQRSWRVCKSVLVKLLWNQYTNRKTWAVPPWHNDWSFLVSQAVPGPPKKRSGDLCTPTLSCYIIPYFSRFGKVGRIQGSVCVCTVKCASYHLVRGYQAVRLVSVYTAQQYSRWWDWRSFRSYHVCDEVKTLTFWVTLDWLFTVWKRKVMDNYLLTCWSAASWTI